MAIITISRGSLTGGAALAGELGARLGARVLSREVIVEAARQYGVSEDDLAEGLSSPPRLWDRHSKQRERYLLAVQAALAEMVQEGNVVYHGLGGCFLLADLPGVVRLRLIAPVEYRVQAAMAELGQDRQAALRYLDEVDARRTRWVRLLYGADWADPALYDLVLNLAHLSLETACEMVADLLGRKEYRHTPSMAQRRRDFALLCRLRAELTFHSGFPEDGVVARVQRGQLLLSGPHYERCREEVLGFLRGVPGAAEALARTEAATAPTSAEKTAADVMLPIQDYPVIGKDRSIREAIAALAMSSVKLADGHVYRPRYILVHDEGERLVGVVARRSLLRGLIPQLRELELTRARVQAIGAHLGELDLARSFRWGSLFGPVAASAAEDSVEGVMDPIRCTVAPGEPLSAVVVTMLQHQVDLVPVVEDRRPVGVVVMTEIFDEVAAHHVRSAAPASAPVG